MNKAIIEGIEYNVVPSPRNLCQIDDARCDLFNQPDTSCATAPCRNPSVIFLTDTKYLKHFITPRLTK